MNKHIYVIYATYITSDKFVLRGVVINSKYGFYFKPTNFPYSVTYMSSSLDSFKDFRIERISRKDILPYKFANFFSSRSLYGIKYKGRHRKQLQRLVNRLKKSSS